MNLDDKLREILSTFHENGEFHDWTDVEELRYIANLKQAFEDAGYISPEERSVKLLNEHAKKLQDIAQGQTLTGREWFDRFMKEFENHWAVEAAKRASGIKVVFHE